MEKEEQHGDWLVDIQLPDFVGMCGVSLGNSLKKEKRLGNWGYSGSQLPPVPPIRPGASHSFAH